MREIWCPELDAVSWKWRRVLIAFTWFIYLWYVGSLTQNHICVFCAVQQSSLVFFRWNWCSGENDTTFSTVKSLQQNYRNPSEIFILWGWRFNVQISGKWLLWYCLKQRRLTVGHRPILLFLGMNQGFLSKITLWHRYNIFFLVWHVWHMRVIFLLSLAVNQLVCCPGSLWHIVIFTG